MSTHADIILQTEDGYKSIYLHFDGYPEHVMNMLVKFYSDRETVEQMIELGNLSVLDESISCPDGHSFNTPKSGFCIFYGRDRGEKDQQAVFSYSLEHHLENSYSYLFTLDGEWKIV